MFGKKIVFMLLVIIIVASIAMVAGSQSANIVRGGTLNFGKIQKFSLDPAHYVANVSDKAVTYQIFETLVKKDDSGNIVPRLATSYDVQDGGATIIFKLREDVVFHDGEKFNAAAVKATFDWYTSEECKARFLSRISRLDSVEVVDEYTVRFNLSEPFGSFISSLCDSTGFIMSPKAIKEHSEELTTYASGTGPFMVEDYLEGEKLTLVRNPNYYEMGEDGQPLPYLDKVIVNVITDGAVLAANIRSGDVDIIHALTRTYVEVLLEDSAINVIILPSKSAALLPYNNQVAPFNNKLVRQAITYGVNRQEIIDLISGGLGSVEPFYISAEQSCYSEEDPYSYDPEKAIKLLAEAGYPDGFSTTLNSMNREPDNTVVQLIQSQLAEIGIDVTLNISDVTGWRNTMRDKERGAVMGFCRGSLPWVDIYFQLSSIMSSKAASNYSSMYIDKVDNLLDELGATYDDDKRKEIASEIQAIVLEEAGWTFIYQDPNYGASRKYVHDLDYEWDGCYVLKSTWKE